MKYKEAEDVLSKYKLNEAASKEFKIKTRKDTGRTNVGLRLRICATCLEGKWVELRDERIKKLKENKQPCPYVVSKKENDQFVHNGCDFICVGENGFCCKCEFYIKNIKEIEASMEELFEAAKCFRKQADYDDSRQ